MKNLILVIIVMFFLMGCEDKQPSTNKLSGLDSDVTKQVLYNDVQYLSKDLLLPNYAHFKTLESEKLFDWDYESVIEVALNDIITITFDQIEPVYAVELCSQNINEITLSFSDAPDQVIQVEAENMLIEFTDFINTQELSMTIVEMTGVKGSISEYHVISGKKVSKELHDEQLKKVDLIKTVRHNFNLVDFENNMADINNYLKPYTESLARVAMLSDLHRFNQFPERLIVYPVLIKGQVLEYSEVEDELYVLVDTHIYSSPIQLIVSEEVEIKDYITMPAVFVGKNDMLVFYGLD